MPYLVYLKEFEGPLDLLLHLISRAKVDIRDIFVSEITEQYLASMKDISSLNMDIASEFLAMAATLLEIKSRALLPKQPQPAEPGMETPEEALIRRLAEYAALKEGVDKMQDFEDAAARMFAKLPEEIPLSPPVLELTNLTIDGLVAAMYRVLTRISNQPERGTMMIREIQRDKLSVQGCMFTIIAKVHHGPCSFVDLLAQNPTRDEIVTVFMAVLELLRLSKLSIVQDSIFGEIVLTEQKVSGSHPIPQAQIDHSTLADTPINEID